MKHSTYQSHTRMLRKFATVYYESAITESALNNQAQELPVIENIIICFGTFHTCMGILIALQYILRVF